MQKISQSRKLGTAVLVLYSLLYLCLVFHFHPINIVNGVEHSFVTNQHHGLSSSHQTLHCEICHLLSTFNYIPASDFTISEISLISFDEFNFQSIPLQTLSFSSNSLRAPPIV